jgi:hypothetical protein
MDGEWIWRSSDLMAQKPPNLKEAHECGDCAYYQGPEDGDGRCKMYDYPVSDDEVCDSWEASDVRDATKRAWKKHRKRLKEAS